MQHQNLKQFLRSKPVKIAGIIVGIAFMLLMGLLVTVSIYVHYHKEKIIGKVKDAFAKNVNGDLQIGNIDVSIWRNFPNISVELENVSIADSLYHRPLLKANEILCSVSLLELTSLKPDIRRLSVIDGTFHLLIDSTGFDNSYLLSPKKKNNNADTTATASSKKIIIHHLQLTNVQFISEDVPKSKKYDVSIRSLEAEVNRDGSNHLGIELYEDCLVQGLGFNLEKGSYLENETIKATWKLAVDEANKTLDATSPNVLIDNNQFNITTSFHFAGDHLFSVHAATSSIFYSDARAILTKTIAAKLNFINLAKPLQVDARLTGPLEHGGDPFVFVTVNSVDNVMQTTLASFTECNFTGVYDNRINASLPPSDPNSVVYFKSFNGKWLNVPMQGDSIRIDNLSDPLFSFKFHSNCTFAQLDSALNFDNINFDDGTARLNLQYKGPLTTNPSLLENISGALQFENGKITYVPHNLQFENCNGGIVFSKNNIIIQKITCNYKKNYFEVTGGGSSINSMLQDNGNKSALACNIFCPLFNVGDFKTVFAHKKTAQKKSGSANIAGIGDFLDREDIQISIKAKQLVLDNFTAQNADVFLLLQKDYWRLVKASLQFGGGSLAIDANIANSDNTFNTTAHLNIQNADVHNAFYAFANFGQDAITYENIRGKLNADAKLQMQLNDSGTIVPGSLQGSATFAVTDGTLINFKPILGIQQYALKNRDLTRIDFATIKDSLIIKNNSVSIPRMEIASTAMRIFVEGVYGLKNNPTDISVQVPLSNLTKPADGAPKNKGVDAKVGPSVYIRAKSNAEGKIKMGLDLFAKFRKKD